MIELISGNYLTFRPKENPKTCRVELLEQIDFVAWVREHHPDYAALMIHPANEGAVRPNYRQQQIKAGMLKGASDIIILKAGINHPAALIELKRCWRKSKPTAEQIAVLKMAADNGKFAAVAHGFEAAKAAFKIYAGITC